MITDTTFVGLVAAACGRPDDDTPRLVLADWLDDAAGYTADPDAARAWAAYIRWGCDGRTNQEPDSTFLRVVNLAGWLDHWPRGGMLSLTRGFPARIEATWADWQRVGHLLSWHPDEFEKSGRACPPTACPGVTVTIRGTLAITEGEAEYIEVLAYLRRRWPGVKAWHLPDVVRPGVLMNYADMDAALTADLMRRWGQTYNTPLTTPGNYASAFEERLMLQLAREQLTGSPVLEPRAFLNIDTE